MQPRTADRYRGLALPVALDDGPSPGAATSATRYEDAIAAHDGGRDFGPRDDGDLYILYTGGTTGMPKGAMWRHEDVWRALSGDIDFVTGEPVTDEHQPNYTRAGATIEQASDSGGAARSLKRPCALGCRRCSRSRCR